MKKILLSFTAIAFLAGAGVPAFAAKHEGEKLAAACKDKKPGDVVVVDGKEMKCPAPKEGKK